jgi:hypothetical protein
LKIEFRTINDKLPATIYPEKKNAFTSSAIPLQGRDAKLKLGYLDFAPCKGRVLALGECGVTALVHRGLLFLGPVISGPLRVDLILFLTISFHH